MRDEVELIEEVYTDFDSESYLAGKVAPVFFGSALNNFGVQELLETFIEISPTPQGRLTDQRIILPDEQKFSGFVFKIHANIDPKHRDRIAFLRIVFWKISAQYILQTHKTQQKIKISQPNKFHGLQQRGG